MKRIACEVIGCEFRLVICFTSTNLDYLFPWSPFYKFAVVKGDVSQRKMFGIIFPLSFVSYEAVSCFKSVRPCIVFSDISFFLSVFLSTHSFPAQSCHDDLQFAMFNLASLICCSKPVKRLACHVKPLIMLNLSGVASRPARLSNILKDAALLIQRPSYLSR